MKKTLLFLSVVLLGIFVLGVVAYGFENQLFPGEEELYKAAKKEGGDVVSYDTGPYWANWINEFKAFQKRYRGMFIVYNDLGSGNTVARLEKEKANPQADTAYYSVVYGPIAKSKGVTQGFKPYNFDKIPDALKDPEGHWIGFSARARVLIYNKNLMSTGEIPNSIFDLTNKMYRGKFAIANPLFGTTTFHIAALFYVLGDKKAKEFLNDIKRNDVIIATSNGDVKKRTSQGQILFGLTDTDDVFSAIKEGEPVNYVFLDQDKDGIGTLIMPNTVCLIKNGPNTENGKKLIDYLLSRKTEEKLAISAAQMPLHKGVKTPNYVASLDDIKAMNIDYEKTAQKMQQIQPVIKNWLNMQ